MRLKHRFLAWAVFLACGLVAQLVAGAVRQCWADSPEPDPIEKLAREWQPRWRGNFAPVSEAIDVGCTAIAWPDDERCVPYVLAVSFRESAWRWRVVGDYPYRSVGLMQLHGAALGRATREQAKDPRTNVWLGLRWLHEAGLVCVRYEGDEWIERSLSAYAGLGCVHSRSARLAMRWAAEIERLMVSR